MLIIFIVGYSYIRTRQYADYSYINVVVTKQSNKGNDEYEVMIEQLENNKIVKHDNDYNEFVQWTDYNHTEFEKLWKKMTKFEAIMLLDYLFLNNVEVDSQDETANISDKRITYYIEYTAVPKNSNKVTHIFKHSKNESDIYYSYHIVEFIYFIHKYGGYIIFSILIIIGILNKKKILWRQML